MLHPREITLAPLHVLLRHTPRYSQTMLESRTKINFSHGTIGLSSQKCGQFRDVHELPLVSTHTYLGISSQSTRWTKLSNGSRG